jgi:SET domain-containing protein
MLKRLEVLKQEYQAKLADSNKSRKQRNVMIMEPVVILEQKKMHKMLWKK